jgi:hypothetical protein
MRKRSERAIFFFATLRADRPDSFEFAQDRLFAAQRRIAQDDNQSDSQVHDMLHPVRLFGI